MKMYCIYTISIIVYFVCAHYFMELLMKMLWACVFGKRERNKMTPILGSIDRIFYAFSLAFGIYSFIGIWLGIKMASRLISSRNIANINKETEDEKFKQESERKNLYMIGSAVSLVLGIIGGVIIRLLFSAEITTSINWWHSLISTTTQCKCAY